MTLLPTVCKGFGAASMPSIPGSDGPGSQRESETGWQARRQRRSHILIITDDLPALGETVNQLRAQLFRVTVSAGWRGYYRAMALRPDIVLLDRGAGQVDGFMIGRLLKQFAGTADIPLIFLLRDAARGEHVQAFELGAVDCVAVPFFPEELLMRIAVHLRSAKSSPSRSAPAATSLPAPDGGKYALVNLAVDAIDREIETIHTVKDLATRVGTHVRKLTCLFRTTLGMSAHQYLMTRKMEVARRLLSDTAMPVHDVAHHLGFNSVCNFTVAFRRNAGMTPTRFRKQRQNERQPFN
jgi:AraC-like DNA-binding protein